MQRVAQTLVGLALFALVIWAVNERNKNIANIVKCGPKWKTEGCDK